MKILVTGASGFIGNALIKDLARFSNDIYGLDNRATEQDFQGLPVKKFFNQDLTQPFHLEESFDYVFHLGALNVTNVGREDYSAYHRANVLGTENLIKAVDTRQFVFMSTAKVYREQEGCINEDAPVEPKTDYARSKLEAEKLCRRYFAEENLTIFRAVNIVGPGQAAKAVIPIFFKNALEGLPLEIVYPPQTSLQMIDIHDVLEAFSLLIKNRKGLGTINLCSDETITLKDLAERIIALCGSQSEVRFANNEQFQSSKVTSKRAQNVLGWEPKITVDSILKNYHEFIMG